MTAEPRISVVIPTRDRPWTLESCLRTVLALPDGDLEIVVHDNSSTEAALQVVSRISDDRVRYVRVRDLAMTDNWEAALASARGDWITLLGDDDGLMPFALDALRAVIGATDTEVVSWRKAKYGWPDRDRDRHKLKIPAPRPARWIDGRRQLVAVLDDPRARYGDLPMIYNAFVARVALQRIRRSDGRLLASRSPDVYSGAALALRSPRFVRVGVPLSVNGLSGASNGVNNLGRPAGSAVAEDFDALNRRAGLHAHPAVPAVRSLAGAALESSLTAIDALEPTMPVDRFRVITLTLADALLFDEREVESARREAIRAAGDDRRLGRRVDRWLAGWDPGITGTAVAPAPVRPRIEREFLQVDASRFGIEDVAGAVEFSAALYDVEVDSLLPGASHEEPRGPRRLLRSAQDRVRGTIR